MASLIAVVGDYGSCRTGGEQYNHRLLSQAQTASFEIKYISFSDSYLDKFMVLPILWKLRFVTRTLWLHGKLCWSHGDVFVDVWMAPYIRFWAKWTSRRVVLMVHHLRGDLEENEKLLRAEKDLINASSCILTVSQSSKKQVESLLHHYVSIDIIPPGFERLEARDASHISDHTLNLLFVGHLTKAKGILDLIEAVALLHKDLSWRLFVVGGASSEPETLQKVSCAIKKHALQGRVILKGYVEDTELKNLYQQSDLFVLPSYWEGYGIVFLEAMSYALPVISTTSGAIPEVVSDGVNGLLVDAGDIHSLSVAIESMIVSQEKRQVFGQHALQAASQAADWEDVEQQFLLWWGERAKHAS